MVKKTLKAIVVAAIWLVLWQLVYMLVGKPVLLPSPLQTGRALAEMICTAQLWLSVGASMLRVVAGFLSGLVAGCVFAVVTHASPLLHSFFRPLMSAVKATPVASFIILAFVWLPVSNVPVFTSFLIVTPIFWSNIFAGIDSTDVQLLEMADIYKMKRGAKLRYLYLPSVAPYFISSVTTGIGMAWKSGIAAEVICRCRNSIGGGLYDSKIALDTDKVFALTAVVIVLSMILEKLAVKLIGSIAGRWQHD